MNWNTLTTESELEEINKRSVEKPQVIFKHSTRCGISSMAKNRLERSQSPGDLDFYFLDLLAHRSLSNKIAAEFSVHHESPQVLVIKNGECVYDESHSGISMDDIIDQARN
ncbi:MAG TPA: bacillithiol system redox-active protein YtxJ [Ferruginibacter sp.]|nr:bacillithiol system redox-active protein YtxJ [Ferruginibacter sp.]